MEGVGKMGKRQIFLGARVPAQEQENSPQKQIFISKFPKFRHNEYLFKK